MENLIFIWSLSWSLYAKNINNCWLTQATLNFLKKWECRELNPRQPGPGTARSTHLNIFLEWILNLNIFTRWFDSKLKKNCSHGRKKVLHVGKPSQVKSSQLPVNYKYHFLSKDSLYQRWNQGRRKNWQQCEKNWSENIAGNVENTSLSDGITMV